MSIAEKLTKLAENEEKVYKAGKEKEWNEFWDIFQDDGNRTDYRYAFAGWYNEANFMPKYKIKIDNTLEGVFQNSNFTNLRQHCLDNGIIIDTTETKEFTNFFRECRNLTYVPEFDTSNATILNQVFYRCVNLIECHNIGNEKITTSSRVFYGCDKLKRIKSFCTSENCKDYTDCFYGCRALEEIEIKGTVAQSGVDLRWSTKLLKASIESFIEALSDTATGKSITFSKTAKQNAFTDEEWATLIGTKSNWTISLA